MFEHLGPGHDHQCTVLVVGEAAEAGFGRLASDAAGVFESQFDLGARIERKICVCIVVFFFSFYFFFAKFGK